MFNKIDLGEVWLPQELIDMVEAHKKSMLEANKDNELYDMLLDVSFSSYFGDFIQKNCYKLMEAKYEQTKN